MHTFGLNVLDFTGVDPTGKTDSADGIQRALDTGRRTILAPSGTYLCGHSLRIRRGLNFCGESGAGWYSGTVLQFPPDSDGIIFDSPFQPGGIVEGGSWATLERMAIQQLHKEASKQPHHGINVLCPAKLRDLWANGWSGDVCHIESSITGVPHGNPNNWSIRDCIFDGSNGHGLFVRGTDANAGHADMLSCMGNGGFGVCDFSFLGNTYTACHTRTNKAGGYCTLDRSAQQPEGQVRYTLLQGCYAEGDQPPNVLSDWTLALWGTFGNGCQGGQQLLPRSAHLKLMGTDPNRSALQVGAAAGQAVPVFMQNDEFDHRQFAVDKQGNLSTNAALQITNRPDQAALVFSLIGGQGGYSGEVGKLVIGTNGGNFGDGKLTFKIVAVDQATNQVVEVDALVVKKP
jgi:hypothetical protein